MTILALTAACSDPAPAPQEPSAPTAEETTPQPTETGDPTPKPTTDGLTVTIGSDEVTFTDVYCEVSGGELRHLIAKTNNRPPLLEVTPGEFAMVKLQPKGAPEKSTSPSGIDYLPDGVTFTGGTIGSVTVEGTLGCTQTDGK